MTEAQYRGLRNITYRQAARERQHRTGPPYTKVGNQIFYSISGFQKYLVDREVQPVRKRRA
jgi:hypothetical protein